MLHEGHQGIERTKQRARRIVFWPGIDNDIDNTVRSCADCQRELLSLPKEPYIRHASPTRPFQVISADLATHAGQQFLVVVDHLSNWPFVFKLGTTSTARQLIHSFRQVFCFAALPVVLHSDNGPQFNAYPLKSFLADWGVEHRTSSPHYPQSNGHAEAAVKSMKRLLRRCWCDGHLDDELSFSTGTHQEATEIPCRNPLRPPCPRQAPGSSPSICPSMAVSCRAC